MGEEYKNDCTAHMDGHHFMRCYGYRSICICGAQEGEQQHLTIEEVAGGSEQIGLGIGDFLRGSLI